MTSPKADTSIGDRPIAQPGDDKFGRVSFADLLARQILALPLGDSHVVGLLGSWGSGKTSIINLAAATLTNGGVAVVHFNPWLFSGAEQLAAAFFREVAAQLAEEKEERWRGIGERLSGYGEAVGALRNAPVVGGYIGAGADALKAAGGAAHKKGRGLTGSLYEQRRQIESVLREAGQRVVVVIDDLDRLDAAEIREVMRLVRLTADFPNLSYLLAFDRRRVAMALGPNEAEGDAFLEKILQVSFDVPELRASDLRKFFISELGRIVDGRDLIEFDPTDWGNLFQEVIAPLLGSPRDVRRIVNVLPFALDVLGKEVCAIDLFALETLRVTCPKVFALLPSFATILTGESSPEKGESPLLPLLDAAGDKRPAIVALCSRLFPSARTYIDNHTYGASSKQEWRRARRVASADVLRVFLEKSLPADVLEASAVRAAFNTLVDSVALHLALHGLNSEQLEHLLGRLEDYEHEYPEAAAEAAIPVLYKHGDRLREGRRGFFDGGARLALVRVVLRLLRRVPEERRLATVRSIATRTESLSWRQELVDMVGWREGAGHKLISEADAAIFEAELYSDVLAADTSVLAAEKDPFGLVMWMFRRKQPPDAVAAWLHKHLPNERYLMALLRSSLSEASAFNLGDSAGRTESTLPWDFFEIALDPDAKSRLGALDPKEGNERTRTAVEVARRYADGWRPTLGRGFGEGNPEVRAALTAIAFGRLDQRVVAYATLERHATAGLPGHGLDRLRLTVASKAFTDRERAAAFDVLNAAGGADTIVPAITPDWLKSGVEGKELGARLQGYWAGRPERVLELLSTLEGVPKSDKVGKEEPVGVVDALGVIVGIVERSEPVLKAAEIDRIRRVARAHASTGAMAAIDARLRAAMNRVASSVPIVAS